MISAIILAAGQSRRMGQPKMLLPWGSNTVLQAVIEAFRVAGLEDILVVTGSGRDQVEVLVGSLARTVFNPDFAAGEMLSSIQTGLIAQPGSVDAALIGLGDQPQIQTATILEILKSYEQSRTSLIVPSYENRRGHPWLVGRERWREISALRPPATMRDFFRVHSTEIRYVTVDNPSILADLDTPQDYSNFRPH